MSWSPTGDRIAYFARTEKMKTLILQNAVNGKVDQRIELKTVDMPESPDISPDGKEVAFSGLVGATGDIFIVDLDSQRGQNVTNDAFGDFAPTWSPDGKSIVYLARASGNDKLFMLDLATGKKTQLTFGTHDDGGAQFIDEDTLVFPSTAIDPNQPVEPEVARNGNIYNIWTLNLKTKELRQFTDTLTGNTSPVVLRDTKPARIGFVTYYKGEYGIHVLSREEPLHTVASSDFGDAALGPPIPFQPPMTHEIVPDNKRKKGAFEKLFLEGRPPVALGVTSGGDLFGGTQVTFTDVLGDKQFNIFAASVSQYRTLSALVHQPVAAAAVRNSGLLADAVLLRLRSVHASTASTTATSTAIRPLRRRRHAAERSRQSTRSIAIRASRCPAASCSSSRSTTSPGCRTSPTTISRISTAACLFVDGQFAPFGLNLVRETTIFREYGPLAGHTLSLGLRIRAELGQPAVASDPRRRRALLPCGSAPTACSRSAHAATRAGASIPATCTSAATRRCAATTTCSSSGTRASSPMPSSGSRSSKRR